MEIYNVNKIVLKHNYYYCNPILDNKSHRCTCGPHLVSGSTHPSLFIAAWLRHSSLRHKYVIALFITSYVLVHDYTFTQIRLSVSAIYRRGSGEDVATLLHTSRFVGGCAPQLKYCMVFFSLDFFCLHTRHYLLYTCKPTTYILSFFQKTMALVKKFEQATWYRTISIGALELNHKYPIICAKRYAWKIGPTVLLTIRYSQGDPTQIFLPKGYSVLTEYDVIEKLIRMLCPSISYIGAFVQQRMPTSWRSRFNALLFHLITGTH